MWLVCAQREEGENSYSYFISEGSMGSWEVTLLFISSVRQKALIIILNNYVLFDNKYVKIIQPWH